MKRIIMKPGEERRITLGHPWVYDNEVAQILTGFGPQTAPASLEPGEIADVESANKKYLGRAFANPNSKIIARIYSPSKDGADKGFFKRRIREALLRRDGARCLYDLRCESARVLFAEADFLPGLIIDRFVGWPLEELEAAVPDRPLSFEAAEAALGPPQSWLSVQFLSYAIDARRDLILEALEETLGAPLLVGREALGVPAGIVERSAQVRELEGLPLREGIIKGAFPQGGIAIFENGFPFAVHLEEGQKTGHYLDQRDNRRLAAAYAANAKVLDACAYTGGFAVHALRAGAASALCVDVSASALEIAKKNAALNGVSEKIATLESDVFEYLRGAEHRKERFDLVILDPPAFAKTHTSLNDALRGYKEINLRALGILNHGGILVSCSCSHALDEERFRRVIAEAAADAGRRLIELDLRRQSPDHPILVGYGESLYLKAGFYRVI
ncbi:class I SAM-dependent rRNA methyltransferase [Leadbettera azotonutricia]|uniref:PUA domain protein n=1 Tax=Leadbettera azotonutricia (strain ATCC BAA-888 / DSM 13862 / ZAS-9) TaxID=545695 RepID=F5YFF1_LEAAZ|nr:class I SAM-dependent rRNA methyltransferase [Leadbettera azotonutricia]AEF80949.1 PUA domain protein [Leadbettera azotonutricia ZAS-9]